MKFTAFLAISAMALVAAAKPASASLLDGQTIDVQYVTSQDAGYNPFNDPNGYTVYQDYGTAVVPTGSSFNGIYFGVFNLSVGDTTESVTNTNAGTAFTGSPYRQGLLVTLLGPDAPIITGVTYAAGSNLGSASDVAFNGSQIFFNVNDEAFVSGTANLNISGTAAPSAAPEPGTLAMGLGGIVLALVSLRSRRA